MWRGLTFLLPFLFCGHVSLPGVCGCPWTGPASQEQFPRPVSLGSHPGAGPPPAPGTRMAPGSRDARGNSQNSPLAKHAQPQALRLLRPRVLQVLLRGCQCLRANESRSWGAWPHSLGFPMWVSRGVMRGEQCLPPLSPVLAALQCRHVI